MYCSSSFLDTTIHFGTQCKTDSNYYQNIILSQMLPAKCILGEWYIFQQDSMPALRSLISCYHKTTIETLEFTAWQLWLSNSLDLMQHMGILQNKVYQQTHCWLCRFGYDFKHSVNMEWAKLNHTIIAAIIRQWRRCLSSLAVDILNSVSDLKTLHFLFSFWRAK